MLDELMGRNRNANPDEKVSELTWEDESNCKYFLVDFCPHELFTNTKADLGPCPNIHDDEMKKQFSEAKESSRKIGAEDDFLRFCQKMLNDVGLKIKRSKERLVLTQMEQAAAAGIPPEKQAENTEKITVLTEKINVLVEQAEKAGCEGDVDEAQNLLKVCDELKTEREELKGKLGLTVPLDPTDKYGPQKAMEVCEICGAFLVIGDPNAKIDLATANKIKKWQDSDSSEPPVEVSWKERRYNSSRDDHLMGKMHMGYARLKSSVEGILDGRKTKREERDKEREQEAEERRKKRAESSRSSKDKDRKDDDDRRRRTRSRSRDRRRGSSRDRRRSRSRDRKRSRSRDRRRRSSRSRSRDRRDRRRSRSRDRRRDRSRDRRH